MSIEAQRTVFIASSFPKNEYYSRPLFLENCPEFYKVYFFVVDTLEQLSSSMRLVHSRIDSLIILGKIIEPHADLEKKDLPNLSEEDGTRITLAMDKAQDVAEKVSRLFLKATCFSPLTIFCNDHHWIHVDSSKIPFVVFADEKDKEATCVLRGGHEVPLPTNCERLNGHIRTYDYYRARKIKWDAHPNLPILSKALQKLESYLRNNRGIRDSLFRLTDSKRDSKECAEGFSQRQIFLALASTLESSFYPVRDFNVHEILLSPKLEGYVDALIEKLNSNASFLDGFRSEDSALVEIPASKLSRCVDPVRDCRLERPKTLYSEEVIVPAIRYWKLTIQALDILPTASDVTIDQIIDRIEKDTKTLIDFSPDLLKELLRDLKEWRAFRIIKNPQPLSRDLLDKVDNMHSHWRRMYGDFLYYQYRETAKHKVRFLDPLEKIVKDLKTDPTEENKIALANLLTKQAMVNLLNHYDHDHGSPASCFHY